MSGEAGKWAGRGALLGRASAGSGGALGRAGTATRERSWAEGCGEMGRQRLGYEREKGERKGRPGHGEKRPGPPGPVWAAGFRGAFHGLVGLGFPFGLVWVSRFGFWVSFPFLL